MNPENFSNEMSKYLKPITERRTHNDLRKLIKLGLLLADTVSLKYPVKENQEQLAKAYREQLEKVRDKL